MNIYRMLGNKIATADALELAERLSAWHDAMVAHERLRPRGCDDECPHTEAPTLWGDASRVFGAHAGELGFLASRARRKESAMSMQGDSR
jgi:hypothetical protein